MGDIEIRDIPGCSSYGVTRNGRVWSRPRHDSRGVYVPGKLLKPGLASNGYFTVYLRDDSGERKSRCLHELVLLAWVGPRPEKGVSRHLNGNRQDNRLENLEWGTYRDNVMDAVQHGTAPGLRGKLDETEVRKLLCSYHLDGTSAIELAETWGLTRQHVHAIVSGRSRKAIWRKWSEENIADKVC